MAILSAFPFAVSTGGRLAAPPCRVAARLLPPARQHGSVAVLRRPVRRRRPRRRLVPPVPLAPPPPSVGFHDARHALRRRRRAEIGQVDDGWRRAATCGAAHVAARGAVLEVAVGAGAAAPRHGATGRQEVGRRALAILVPGHWSSGQVTREKLNASKRGELKDCLLPCLPTERSSQKLYAGAQASSLLASHPPAPATTDRVIGHLGTYVEIIVSRLGCHTRGRICGVAGESQLPRRASCARKGIHCGIVLVTCLGCHTSTPVASQVSHNDI